MELNEWVLPVAHNRSLNLLYSLVGTDELWLYTTTYNTIRCTIAIALYFTELCQYVH